MERYLLVEPPGADDSTTEVFETRKEATDRQATWAESGEVRLIVTVQGPSYPSYERWAWSMKGRDVEPKDWHQMLENPRGGTFHLADLVREAWHAGNRAQKS